MYKNTQTITELIRSEEITDELRLKLVKFKNEHKITEEDYWAVLPYNGGEHYIVSSAGVMGSLIGNTRIMSPSVPANGYPQINMQDNGKRFQPTVHRMVAEAFIINTREGVATQVNHIDSTRDNNVYTNLEWVTPRENISHARKEGNMIKREYKNKGKKPVNDTPNFLRHGAAIVYEATNVETNEKTHLIGINEAREFLGAGSAMIKKYERLELELDGYKIKNLGRVKDVYAAERQQVGLKAEVK